MSIVYNNIQKLTPCTYLSEKVFSEYKFFFFLISTRYFYFFFNNYFKYILNIHRKFLIDTVGLINIPNSAIVTSQYEINKINSVHTCLFYFIFA